MLQFTCWTIVIIHTICMQIWQHYEPWTLAAKPMSCGSANNLVWSFNVAKKEYCHMLNIATSSYPPILSWEMARLNATKDVFECYDATEELTYILDRYCQSIIQSNWTSVSMYSNKVWLKYHVYKNGMGRHNGIVYYWEACTLTFNQKYICGLTAQSSSKESWWKLLQEVKHL